MAVPTLQGVANSLRQTLGIAVTSINRQTRWRPCWFVAGERDGVAIDIVVRGDRDAEDADFVAGVQPVAVGEVRGEVDTRLLARGANEDDCPADQGDGQDGGDGEFPASLHHRSPAG